MLLYDPCELNLDDQELQKLADFLRGYRLTDDALEMALEICFRAGECELTHATRDRLARMLPAGNAILRMIEQ
jgi:hypothetical protein